MEKIGEVIMKCYFIYIMTIILIIVVCVLGSIIYFSYINTTKTLEITKVGEYTVSPVENLEGYDYLDLSFLYCDYKDPLNPFLWDQPEFDPKILNPPYSFGIFEKYPDYFAELAKIPVDKFDVKHNTYVVSFEHELEKITYQPSTNNGGPFVNRYSGNFYFKSTVNPNTTYIYEIKDIKIWYFDEIYIDGMTLAEYKETRNEK